MSDTRAIKPEDNKGGTFTQQLDVAEVTTAYVSPVPAEAPGVITAEPGTLKEEAIYFKSRDAGAGTISGLTRDYTNLNGGVGQEHANSKDWEVFQSAFYVKNLVDILLEGFFREQNTVARVDDDNFTVLGNVAIFYTTGRLIRFNGDNDEIASVVSSSYSAGTGLTTVVTAAAVPATLTYIELGLQPKTAAYLSNQDILDEDNMASNSATKVPSQQSTKAYADKAATVVQMVVFNFTDDAETGDGKFYFVVPAKLNGMNLTSAVAQAITAGTTGTMDIQVANVTDSVDMLSTKLTIDSAEKSSLTAATPVVIDATKDDVVTDDLLRIDIDAVQTTKAKGLIVTLGFSLP